MKQPPPSSRLGRGSVNASVNETGRNRLRRTRGAMPLATTEHLSAHVSAHNGDPNCYQRLTMGWWIAT